MSLVVAAFDFDGTLTYHDSLLPFLRYSQGTYGYIRNFASVSPLFAWKLIRQEGRQALKECVLTQFFHGAPLEQLREQASSFAQDLLPTLVRPEALARLRWHQEQGHRCVLISATLDLYLEPWARAVGIHDVLGSRLEVNATGCVTGRLVGRNCWGPEKVRRLEQLMGPREDYVLYAYGDSRGDQELLSYAHHAYYRTMPEEA